MDRIDGPYYLFGAIHKLRNALPPWVTLPGFDGPTINMVPVDYVADAIDAIAPREGFDGAASTWSTRTPPRFFETFNLIAERGRGT